MSQRTKILLGLLALTVAFASGRWSVQAPTVKTTENIHQIEDKTQDKDTHTQTTIVSTKKPDGTVTTVTNINTDTVSQTKEKDNTTANIQQTVTPPKTSTVNISALIFEDLSKGLPAPAYGASVSKQVLGPIRLGVFGLTTGVVGVSIGLDF